MKSILTYPSVPLFSIFIFAGSGVVGAYPSAHCVIGNTHKYIYTRRQQKGGMHVLEMYVSPITWLLIQCMWLSFLSKSDVCFRNQADNQARVLHRATRTQWDDISHLGRNLKSLLSLFSAVVHPQPNQIICPQQWCVLLYSVAANSF